MTDSTEQAPWSVQVDFEGNTADASFAAWREEIGRHFLRFDFQPLDEGPVQIHTQMHAFANVVVGRCSTTAMEYRRTSDLVRDGANEVVLILPAGTPLRQGSDNIAVEVDSGSMGLWDVSVPSFARIASSGEYNALRLDRERLRAFCPDVDDRVRDAVLRLPDVGRLLRRYIALVSAPGYDIDAAARVVIGQHMIDLAALALGAAGDLAHEARRNGLPAARLAEIKTDIIKRLHDPKLSVQALSQSHKISERYLQALFEQSGSTFTEFVLDQRLQLAFRLLCDPGYRNRKVSDVAHSTGFGDLSYFHRAFRRRFGDTPVGIRTAAARPGPQR